MQRRSFFLWGFGALFGAGVRANALERGTAPRHFNLKVRIVKLNNGCEMPVVGLGTYSVKGETCVRTVEGALKLGVRLIDTATVYGNEREVGEGVRAAVRGGIPREEIFVTSKLYPNEFADAERAIDRSLERLDVGRLDLMLLHHPGSGDAAAYRAVERAVSDGRIRSVGLSNWYVCELTDFLPRVETPPVLVQNEIHPYYQEKKVVPFIQKHGIVVQGWYPFGGRGWTKDVLGNGTIGRIAAAHGKTAAQVILRWNLQREVAVIPGSSNLAHVRENLDVFDFSLSAEEMAAIAALDRGEKHDWY